MSCKCTSKAGCGCNQCCPATGLFKFSGITLAGPSTVYLPDVGSTVTPPTDPNNYSPAERYRVMSLSSNLQTVVPAGVTLTVNVLKNGAVILSTSYVAGETGVKRSELDVPVSYSPSGNDLFDVQAVVVGTTATQMRLSGTVGYRT